MNRLPWLGAYLVLLPVVVAVGEPGHLDGHLLVAAGMLCLLASIPTVPLRGVAQVVLLVAVGAALVAVDRSWTEVAAAAGGLFATMLLANRLTAGRRVADVETRGAQVVADRRADLLDAVRDLAGSDLSAAATITVRAVRALGLDGAAVALLGEEDGQLHTIERDGLTAPDEALPPGTGLAPLAIEQDRTVVSADYQREPRRVARRPEIGSVVVSPIRVDSRPVGALIGTRRLNAAPTAAEVEVVEVLAAHLGRAIDTDAQVVRQHELLLRMAQLDLMRTGFVAAVSSELRDPLTVVRAAGQTLSVHGDQLTPAVRQNLLDGLCGQAAELRTTIGSLLDFSRFQLERAESRMQVIRISDLLAPVLEATGAVLAPESLVGRDTTVRTDPKLVRHALELLIGAGGPARGDQLPTLWLETADGEVRTAVRGPDGAGPSSLNAQVISQLLVAADGRLDPGPPAVLTLPVFETDEDGGP